MSPYGRSLALAFTAVALAPPNMLPGQVLDVRPITPPAVAPPLSTLRTAQEGFESFRREHLPIWNSRRPTPDSCDERIGRFCYWYDENEPDPPREPETIRAARQRLISQLDSAARAFPNDRWISGQRVRYLTESDRFDDAVAAARECTVREWWCSAVQGFALHVAGRYAAADTAYTVAVALMDSRQRCDWRDLKLVIDDALMRRYRDMNCANRLGLEDRVWWLSRPMLSSAGNDARTEYYSRLMMAQFIEDAPSVYQMGFGTDERELLLRYGWPRAWTRDGGFIVGGGAQYPVVGHEPTPAPPMIPAPGVLDNPASSDSAGWRSKGIPPVRARYSPEYAKHLIPLEHQAALFRRGDSALVVVAWSIARDSALSAAVRKPNELTAALVLTKGDPRDATVVRDDHPGERGTLTARALWGSMLMSTEIAAPSRRTLARARYGVRGSDVPGSRVQISDLLLFDAYDGMPGRLEDVIPHMRSSQRIVAGARVGIYWEAYNTNPTGEGLNVSITVAPENSGGGGWLRRRLVALRLVREAQPVTIGMRDVSARGLAYSPRSVVVDLATLNAGRYLMQLELDAGGGNVVRAERAITVVNRE
jgi:hypothetical protein